MLQFYFEDQGELQLQVHYIWLDHILFQVLSTFFHFNQILVL